MPRRNDDVSGSTSSTEVTEEVKRTPLPATGQVVLDQEKEQQEECSDGTYVVCCSNSCWCLYLGLNVYQNTDNIYVYIYVCVVVF